MERLIYGWKSIEDAAAEIYRGVNDRLLDGDPIILLRNSGDKSNLEQLVVVRNCDYEKKCYTDFGVGFITSGWTALYPHMPLEYLETDLLDDLKNYKLDKKFLDNYKQLISNLK